jgi:hypothetical protein
MASIISELKVIYSVLCATSCSSVYLLILAKTGPTSYVIMFVLAALCLLKSFCFQEAKDGKDEVS